ncbi:putative oxidoreductase [Caenibius tardaugens NBRC 16725]|uniref:Putative oxidoreductase n=1 Tax=Caenibius tardaugens NBRC 16725 TaxID=1219035 RepID=U2YJU7_9SPHN|nr:SDR family oxidoreductase [Caenibius tardaugens]AZI34952.1 SDR family oxidoreductase [Caenibius tardaugens NBRC 16725]GAD48497.1 putative oxidoreductase [Caenibius tardaugens NBRC 16725]
MARTILITGAASGICKATAELCRAAGDTVISVDIRDADIIADLSTGEGRATMLREAERLAPNGLDAVLAGAGLSRADMPRETVAVNYFGAVATLEGLRPLLLKSARPRAVVICSTAAILPGNDLLVETCLAGDEAAALAIAGDAPRSVYPDSKRAISKWLRRTAGSREWAGSGILLNGVGPGVVETAMTAPMLKQPEMVEMIKKSNPMAVEGYAQPEEIAELLVFLLGFTNHYMVGQLIFIDGGTDIIMRPEQV